MPTPALQPIFDGHNDVLWRLWNAKSRDAERAFVEGGGGGHLDLPRMAAGGFAGGLFAVYIPSENMGDLDALMHGKRYDVPLPPPIASAEALPIALAMIDSLFRLERASAGKLRVCRSAAEIRAAMKSGSVAAVLHFEGAEAIASDLTGLEALYHLGLRSIGPVWSRPTGFGHGVPFRYPATGDTGPGLTDAGKALVRACDGLGIAIDLSHMTEKGFWDVARISSKPLIATHSNAYAVCPHARNLSDKQLAAIAESGGMVGLNFATCFLRPDGQNGSPNDPTSVDLMLRHLDHLIGFLGIDHVGLGSDFDGASVPEAIGDVAGLPVLVAALKAHGFDAAVLNKLCCENWLRTLEKSWQPGRS